MPQRKASKRSALAAFGLAVLALGGAAIPAQADAANNPGKHVLKVHVPSDVKSIGVVGAGVQKCFDIDQRRLDNHWYNTNTLVNNNQMVNVWGYTVGCLGGRDTDNQKYADKGQAGRDGLQYLWITLKNLRADW
ncbi:hypothetical protein [Streptomyces chartreusis]|uniref:Uncharacterized protein n=1 Tax=Streptomyces chartreusis TaxID=1969 RepID=A0A7H8T0W7_STRCX|nr:hypothetical protein [Streptomyces chartreusis]QKZ17156.1 hypothetical protein HUT05_07120 [Streptomyces chartreusis]